jgi:hypothetical protein
MQQQANSSNKRSARSSMTSTTWLQQLTGVGINVAQHPVDTSRLQLVLTAVA